MNKDELHEAQQGLLFARHNNDVEMMQHWQERIEHCQNMRKHSLPLTTAEKSARLKAHAAAILKGETNVTV